VSLTSTIAERLQFLMAQRALNATQLAKLAEVKPSFIYDILNGKSANPSPVRLSQLAKALGVDISRLIGSEGTSRTLQVDMPYDTVSSRHAPTGDDDYVTISSVLVEASMGGGAVVAQEEQGKPYYFRREWIRNRLGVSPSELRMIFVRGDSMEPTLCANDMILIDTTKRMPSPSGIFVLFDGMGLVAKRLELMQNPVTPVIRILSDNPQYSAYERPPSELHIIGRVVWFAREL